MDKIYKLSVPVSMDDITINQYQKYIKVIEDNKDLDDPTFINLKLLNIFCDISMKEAYELPLDQFDYILNHLSAILSDKPDLQTRFSMTDPKGDKIEFGFIPNLDKMSLGEYIDAESYLGNWEDMHKAMSVLYRPIVAGNKDFYKIEKYETSEKYADIMKDAPCTVAIGSILFFLTLGIELSKITLGSLLKHQETLKDQDTNKDLEKNGDGISQYIHSQKEMYLKLTKLQKLIFTKR
tara:strand:+ start:292 stop:1002 length:711 start_codon:yes stop_codon:yes gene_type:complete